MFSFLNKIYLCSLICMNLNIQSYIFKICFKLAIAIQYHLLLFTTSVDRFIKDAMLKSIISLHEKHFKWIISSMMEGVFSAALLLRLCVTTKLRQVFSLFLPLKSQINHFQWFTLFLKLDFHCLGSNIFYNSLTSVMNISHCG